MKCQKCGTALPNGVSKCPLCGTKNQNIGVTYEVPTKTKNKVLAALLMLFGLGEPYLCQWKRWFIKIFIVGIITFSIGTLIWNILDAIRIMTGKINCDAHGVPLV